MKKSFVNLVSVALALALGQFCSGAAFAAPVVVTPGTNAGYIYFPPASVGGSGSGGTKTLAEGGDANANNCTTANVFPTVVTHTTSGSVVIPKTIKCIYLEAGGGVGAVGKYTCCWPVPGVGGAGALAKTIVFNNSGVDLNLSWSVALANANGGAGGLPGATAGQGGLGAGFNGPTGLMLVACGGGGGGASAFGGQYGLGGASVGGQAGQPGQFIGETPVAGTSPGALCTTTFVVGLNPSASYVKYAY